MWKIFTLFSSLLAKYFSVVRKVYDYEQRIERAKRFAKIWWKSRYDAGKSQEFIALSMGVSKKTIQNWEKGLSSPNLIQASEWFQLLGLNPLKYFLEFLYPNFSEAVDSKDEIEQDKILISLIKSMSAFEKNELIYIMSGAHGSSWPALLQLFSAYCQMSLQSRVIIARLVLESYEMEEKNGRLVNNDKIKPDLELLKSAIAICKAATQNGYYGYSTVFFNEFKDENNNEHKSENKKAGYKNPTL